MIIICDGCGVRYQVEGSDIGDEGREVKCSKCDHVWLQPPFSGDDQPFDLEMNRDNNTVTIEKESNCRWLRFSSILLIILIGISLFMIPRSEIGSVLRPIYSIFGIYDSVDLEFESARFESQGEEGILITSTVVNNSDEKKVLPNMKISLYDEGDNVLRKIHVVNKDNHIEKGQQKIIQQQIKKVPNNTKYIVLDIGNKLEMWFQ